MKLNEYIFKRIMNMFDPDTMSDYFTEDDVEKILTALNNEIRDIRSKFNSNNTKNGSNSFKLND